MMFRRADGVVLQLVDDRAFLLDEGGTEMIVLNVVGTMVWQALDEPLDADAIAGALVGRFEDVSQPQLVNDVGEFLDELAELGLVVPVT
jgi:Coenzyme PQQ synthesis protein D (PqqD)